MVKIISKKPDKSVIKRVVCKDCGATLEYVPNDVKTSTGTYMGEASGSDYIKCPNCNKQVILRSW